VDDDLDFQRSKFFNESYLNGFTEQAGSTFAAGHQAASPPPPPAAPSTSKVLAFMHLVTAVVIVSKTVGSPADALTNISHLSEGYLAGVSALTASGAVAFWELVRQPASALSRLLTTPRRTGIRVPAMRDEARKPSGVSASAERGAAALVPRAANRNDAS